MNEHMFKTFLKPLKLVSNVGQEVTQVELFLNK